MDVRNDSILIPNRALGFVCQKSSGINGIMLESVLFFWKNGGLSTYVVNVFSILQEHWTYVESLGLAKLPGEETGAAWPESLVN